MRRIIERVVTVVTTTTWKISWETDPPAANPVSDELSPLATLPEFSPSGPTTIEVKEAESPEEENAPDQS